MDFRIADTFAYALARLLDPSLFEPRDVGHVGSSSETDAEYGHALLQARAVEDDRLALLDVGVGVALIEEPDKEVRVTGSIDLGEQGHILIRQMLSPVP